LKHDCSPENLASVSAIPTSTPPGKSAGILARNSFVYFFGGVVINGAGLLMMPIYTRFLSPREYGIIGCVAVFTTLLTAFLGFGFSSVVSRFYFDAADGLDWRSFLGTLALFMIGVGALITIALFFFGKPLLDSAFGAVRFQPYLRFGLWIAFFGAFSAIPLAIFQAKGEALQYRLLTSCSFVVLTLSMLLFVVILHQGALGALRSQLIAGGLMACFYSWSLVRAASFQFRTRHLKQALQFGLPIMFYTLLGFSTEMSSRYLVERLTNLSQTGLYTLALLYSSGLALVGSAINMAWVPIYFRRAKQPDWEAMYRRYSLFFLSGMAGLGLAMALFSREALAIIASASFREAYRVVPLLLVSNLLATGVWTLLINPLFFMKRTHSLAWLSGLSASICVLSNLVLVPRWGISGAAASLAFSNLVLVIAVFPISQRAARIDHYFGKLAAVLASAVGIFLLSMALPPMPVLRAVFFKSMLLAGFGLLLLLYKVVTPNEIGESMWFFATRMRLVRTATE
jgi:O-antigen/teichoic acid export membrane protein